MQFEYKTKGTCSQAIFFEIEDGKVHNVHIVIQSEAKTCC